MLYIAGGVQGFRVQYGHRGDNAILKTDFHAASEGAFPSNDLKGSPGLLRDGTGLGSEVFKVVGEVSSTS